MIHIYEASRDNQPSAIHSQTRTVRKTVRKKQKIMHRQIGVYQFPYVYMIEKFVRVLTI